MSRELPTGVESGVPDRPRWPWYLSDRFTVFSAALIIAAGVAVTGVLWTIADSAPPENQPAMHFDAVVFGATAAAAGGVVIGLILQFRRQRMAEHTHAQDDAKFQLAIQAQQHIEADATARRVTETMTKAIEQFATGNVVVRLAGLQALERVAQENNGQRQAIIDLICAYLRMPFAPPTGENLRSDTFEIEERAAQDELQVRLAAQKVIADHTRIPSRRDPDIEPPEQYWPNLFLDLTGATLISFSMRSSVVRIAVFAGCTFYGRANFSNAKITMVDFNKARFSTGDEIAMPQQPMSASPAEYVASFSNAEFHTGLFAGADFEGPVTFSSATFTGSADFGIAGSALYDAHTDGPRPKPDDKPAARFRSDAVFSDVTFRNASFGYVEFDGRADFSRITTAEPDNFYFAGARHRPTRRPRSGRQASIWPDGWRLGDDEVLVAIPTGPDGTWPELKKPPHDAGRGRRRAAQST